ncbi:MAG: DUF4272 domain-containing protein [Oscillospiraceae bacterium]|nr:DUF4272 domain-containing protein [Oscillospiraceae bacterium]
MSVLPEKSPEQRRQENITFLKSHGVKTMAALPVIESAGEVTLRSKEEVVKRMLGLLLISLYAEGMCAGEKRDDHKAWVDKLIDRYGAADFFTPKEKTFLENEEPAPSESVHFSWQYEPLTVLLWALGLLETEDALGIPAAVCDMPKVMGAIKIHPTYDAVFETAVLRDKETVLDQADLIYRYDWACVDERIHSPEGHREEWGVAMERHKALNWLINYGFDGPQDWDHVSTDT